MENTSEVNTPTDLVYLQKHCTSEGTVGSFSPSSAPYVFWGIVMCHSGVQAQYGDEVKGSQAVRFNCGRDFSHHLRSILLNHVCKNLSFSLLFSSF